MHKKRFIAGAVCPQCNKLDKIFTYTESGQQWRACVACSFVECFVSAQAGAPAVADELPTRVNQNRVGEQPLAHETPVEPVTLVEIDPTAHKPAKAGD
ncbi:MAG: YheV family putative metal-binding protein [Pseudomonadales bacterium]|nr:YheV family putative metal-binding protein [Gammaproteobacteria bacterium]NNL57570.1 YheV family putative metal-binding protein [Pseudomonadales bacterium]